MGHREFILSFGFPVVSWLTGSAHSLASCADHVWGWIHRSRNPEGPLEPSFRVSAFGTEESRIVIAYTIFWGEGFFLEKNQRY